MKKNRSSLALILAAIGAILLRLRYSKKITGMDKIKSRGTSGILFLPNHPALIDPVLIMTILYPHFYPRALADEYQINKPVIKTIARLFGIISLPNLSRGGISGAQQIKQSLQEVCQALKNGDNVLIYPAGHIKRGRFEDIGAASAVAAILQEIPGVRVVLIRQNGLWGSRFSFGFNGKMPVFGTTLLQGIKTLLCNFIFFAPKRPVTYEFTEPDDLPGNTDKSTLNKYLENYYNASAAPNTFVPYTLWDKNRPGQVAEPTAQAIPGSAAQVSETTKKIVLDHLSKISDRTNIKETDRLSYELGMDSLGIVELVVWIEKEFGFSLGTPDSLKTVGDLMLAASGQGLSALEADLKPPSQKWFAAKNKKGLLSIAEGKTITEVFLNQAIKNPAQVIVADQTSGEKTYRDLLVGVCLLKPLIEQLEGTYIGIMLPASVAATTFYFAALFSGKIPVMVNWTMGKRNLQHSLELLKVKKIITAQKLLKKLDAQGAGPGLKAESLILVENLSKSFGAAQKLKALLRARMGLCFLNRAKVSETAVVLFTSGSESLPKAVPLTHKNLLTNICDVTKVVALKQNDILTGMLPPFHSFGLTVTMVFPLCCGMRVVYHVNPVESAILAKIIQTYGTTMLVGTPTFLSGIARVATSEQLKPLRLAFTGAEKCPPELYASLSKLCPGLQVLEGYGITECSPVVSINSPEENVAYSIGKPLASVEHVIVHPETLKRAGDNETGLLLVRGDSIFDGYLHFNGESPFVTFENKKWYRTGDLVEQTTEGVLFFKGRLKRFIKIGGEMISLPAIEDVLKPHFSAETDEGPQIAVEASGPAESPELVLFTTRNTDRNQVNTLLRNAGLSPINNIRRVIKMDAIPVLGTGKTDYQTLKERLK